MEFDHPDRKGIDPRSEWVPATIDAQYSVGYDGLAS